MYYVTQLPKPVGVGFDGNQGKKAETEPRIGKKTGDPNRPLN